jgi:anti-sigma factor RsiW
VNCRQAERLLPEAQALHRDNPILHARLNEHLRQCERCQAQAEQLRKTLDLLAQDEIPVPPESDERFLFAVKRQSRSLTRPHPSFLRWLPPLAAAAVLLILLSPLSRRWRSLQPTNNNAPGQSLESLLVASDPDLVDPLAVETGGVLSDADYQTITAVESELVEESELEDLLDELTPQEQTQLLEGLKGMYGRPNG